MDNLLEDLLWLPSPPEDFITKLGEASHGDDLRKLAQFSLNDSQLTRLSKKFKKIHDNNGDLSSLVPLSMGVISNSTTDLIVPAITGTALHFGIALTVVEAKFDQVMQETFSDNSSFAHCSLNALLVAIDLRGLPVSPCPGNSELAHKNVKHCIEYLHNICDALNTKTGAKIILQNLARPSEAVFGSLESRLPGTLSWITNNINAGLNSISSEHISLLDIDTLSSSIGLMRWHDPTLWNIAKLPFSQKYTPVYASHICRMLASQIGKSRRCLVLDLDNTLWGGVIGDDGIEGILLGNGDPTGEAYTHIQTMALELRERGVVLAISSKNEDKNARQPFIEHPDMVLREKHIAVFQANWSDKASNIKAIADTLSLGLESIVFLDDNPAERMQVRMELPAVAVPELPEDPALYVRTLIAGGYFEATSFSVEDSQRASFYQGNARRLELLNQSSDMNSYLASLEMKISFNEFNKIGRLRIAQLISKSNQFNLTTKRYDELQVKALEEDKSLFTLQVRLQDQLGDNGMISVIICKKNQKTWLIDTWLMSCRVLGRRVEEAVLQHIITHAAQEKAVSLIGSYIPTARNGIVKDHYKKLGFQKLSVKSDNGSEKWELAIKNYQFKDLPIAF